jgi:hypothetical protein
LETLRHQWGLLLHRIAHRRLAYRASVGIDQFARARRALACLLVSAIGAWVANAQADTCPVLPSGGSVARIGVDGALLARYAVGMRGAALYAGLSPAQPATNAQSYIEANLERLDIDGDGDFDANDALILVRQMAGFESGSLVRNIAFSANAKRKARPAVAAYLASGCALGRDIYVAPGESITNASYGAVSGDRIVLGAGIYDEQQFYLRPGVSLVGAGRDGTTIRFSQFSYWQGGIRLRSESEEIGGQLIADLTIDGSGAKAWGGIEVHNRSDVYIHNVKATGFYDFAISVLGSRDQKSSRVEISDSWIGESSREQTGDTGARGNLLLSGNLERLVVRDNEFVTNTSEQITGIPATEGLQYRSGYAIKAVPYYEGGNAVPDPLVSNSKFVNNTFACKPNGSWQNGLAPNFTIEFKSVNAENVEIAHNPSVPCMLSLEYNENKRTARSFWVHNNQFNIQKNTAIEFAISDALVEDNVFDFRNANVLYHPFGEFNGKPPQNGQPGVGVPMHNQIVRRNKIYLGDHAPPLFVVTLPVKNWRFEDNEIYGTKRPKIMEFRRASSDGSDGLFVLRNRFESGYDLFNYVEGSSGIPPTNVVIVNP